MSAGSGPGAGDLAIRHQRSQGGSFQPGLPFDMAGEISFVQRLCTLFECGQHCRLHRIHFGFLPRAATRHPPSARVICHNRRRQLGTNTLKGGQ